MNLRSSVENKGKVVTQIIHGIHGTKATIDNIKTDTIIEGRFTKFETTDGRMILVNPDNVVWIEVFGQ